MHTSQVSFASQTPAGDVLLQATSLSSEQIAEKMRLLTALRISRERLRCNIICPRGSSGIKTAMCSTLMNNNNTCKMGVKEQQNSFAPMIFCFNSFGSARRCRPFGRPRRAPGRSCRGFGHDRAGFAQGGDFARRRALAAEMIAPACPIRLPAGAVRPPMNAAMGFPGCDFSHSAASSSPLPPISPISTIASVSGSS